MSTWIGVFGVMKSVMSDNGGEFSSEETRDVASILNWKLCTTGAESPFQNGLCERNHAVCDNILTKLQAQYPKTPLPVLLKWANMAKNSLAMWNGFSSNQLVFGKNPNLPNILSDKLPALEGVTQSQTLAMHLNALHAARQEFIRSETDERIRRALKHKVRTSEEFYSKGDQVFYKKEDSERWFGPATVVCQDGKVIFARHGGSLVRLSPTRVSKHTYKSESSIKNDELHKDGIVDEQDEQGIDEDVTAPEAVDLHNREQADEIVVDPTEENCDNLINPGVQPENVIPDGAVQDASRRREYKKDDEPERRSLRVFNQETGSKIYMVTIPKSQHKSDECVVAKQIELEKLARFDVYENVEDMGQKAISTRWILWKKGSEIRARLVARGFEEEVFADIDSPTVGKGMVRMVLTLAASMNWELKTTDIKSAFLQGLPLTRDVYLVPPPEADVEPGCIWKLKKCLYGLSDAARRFYDSVVEELIRCGCVKASFDHSFFYLKNTEGRLIGVIAAHIDDFLHAGTIEFEEKVMKKLCSRFLAGKQKEQKFSYVGYQITQLSTGILLDQNAYVESIDIKNQSAERESQKEDNLTTGEMTDYRAMVGSLNWIVQGSRPDLAFIMTDLSTKFQKGKVADYAVAKKVLVKAKTAKCEVFFPNLGNPERWTLVVSADASLNNLNCGVDSCMGYIALLVNDAQMCSPLSWRSGKIKRVVRSTIAAEALALIEGLEDGLYIQHAIKELLDMTVPIIGFSDHRGLNEAVRSTKLTDDRRLRIDISAIKEMLKDGIVKEIRFCSSDEQLADSLTKKTSDNKRLLHCLQNGIFNLLC